MSHIWARHFSVGAVWATSVIVNIEVYSAEKTFARWILDNVFVGSMPKRRAMRASLALENYRGKIEVESEVHAGSTFTIKIPISKS